MTKILNHAGRVLNRWRREPLVHFIVLGVALFAGYHVLTPSAPTRRIVLSDSVIDGLRQEHLRRSGSLPTPAEEAALVDRFIDDEVLYREALALELDRGDIIVRRRLVQKMEFLNESLQDLPEPTEAELQQYAAAHPERYAQPERTTLTHVFVSRERYGPEARAHAEALRSQLLNGAQAAGLGDPFL